MPATRSDAPAGFAPEFVEVVVPSGAAPVTGSLDGVEASDPFTPILGRPFNLRHKPVGFTGSYQLEKHFSGDAPDDWAVALAYADLVDLPETFSLTETESGVTYRWNMPSRTAGSVIVRISA